MKKIKREKIGVGFYPNAHGCGFQKTANVYLIDGKAYAKSHRLQEYDPAFPNEKGLIRVNKMTLGGQFAQVSAGKTHEDYKDKP